MQNKTARLAADCFVLVTRTGLPACGRAASRGKRAPGTFSDTARFESRGNDMQNKTARLAAETARLAAGVHKTVLKAKLIWASGWQGWQQKRKMIHILCVNHLPLSLFVVKELCCRCKRHRYRVILLNNHQIQGRMETTELLQKGEHNGFIF